MSLLSAQHRGVLRYFYAAIAIVVFSTVLLLTAVFGRYLAETRDRNLLETFHLRSLTLISEASQRLSTLQRQATNAPDPETSSSSQRWAALRLRAPGEALAALEAIQSESGEPIFVETLNRANRQFQELQEDLQTGGSASSRLAPDLEALSLTLFQLSRLHSITAESLVQDLDTRGSRMNRLLILTFGVVVLLAGLVVAKTLSLLRASLLRHAKAADDLLDRERQLQQASKMEALGTLVGGVAHDFNNLLTAILGRCELLGMNLDPQDPIRADLREISRAGEKAATLTRQLLAFSRQEQIEPRTVDLNLLLRDSEPLLRRLLPEDISLTVEFEPHLCDVEVDPVQIEQVIVNLAVNARDAMREGGTLRIRTRNQTVDAATSSAPLLSAGSYARLTVEDTGCGIDPEVRAKIFEPFFTTKERGYGTGLGLSTVHGIVKRSKGYITVESKIGRGSRFDVYLPWVEHKQQEPCDTDGIRIIASGSATVLLAEDDEPVRNLVATSLREAGYHVLVARDGEEAVEICEEHDGSIDLILTDVVMPGLRGPALAAHALTLHPEARVVFISGYTDSEILKSTALSSAPLVQKPFKLQRLLEVVAVELDQTEQQTRHRT